MCLVLSFLVFPSVFFNSSFLRTSFFWLPDDEVRSLPKRATKLMKKWDIAFINSFAPQVDPSVRKFFPLLSLI